MHFSVKHFFSLANWPASLTLSTVEVVPIYAFISPRLFILVSGFLTILADDDDVDAYLIFVTGLWRKNLSCGEISDFYA